MIARFACVFPVIDTLSVLFPVEVSLFDPVILTVFVKLTPDTIRLFALPVIIIVPVSPDHKEPPVNISVCNVPLYTPVVALINVNCEGNVSSIVNKDVVSGPLFT